MMHGSWDIEHDGQNVWTILDHFLPFYPFNNQENQNFEIIIIIIIKMAADIIILNKCIKHDHMVHCSWDTTSDRCNFSFSFWAIFWPFTPLTTQKTKILKKWKKCLEISLLYTCVPKIMTTWCTVFEIWCLTDGQTDWPRMDRWKKWQIEVGAPPKNKTINEAKPVKNINKNHLSFLNTSCVKGSPSFR